MNTDRESQCIKYERDVQLGEATRKARTGKVLRSAQQRISVYQIRKRCGARGGYKESAYKKCLDRPNRESQCIKYKRDVQLGEATRKARTGKVLRSAQGSRCQRENLSVSNTKEMCSSGRLQGKRVQERS